MMGPCSAAADRLKEKRRMRIRTRKNGRKREKEKKKKKKEELKQRNSLFSLIMSDFSFHF